MLKKAYQGKPHGGCMSTKWIIFDLCDVLFFMDDQDASLKPIEENSRILKRIPNKIDYLRF